MGQKVNPIGFRVGFNRAWRSMWYASKKDFPIYLYEDAMIRRFIKKKLEGAAVSKVTIERAANRVRVNIHTARPGVVIGRKAAELDKLKDEIRAITTKDREILVDVKEIKNPELDAQLVAEKPKKAKGVKKTKPAPAKTKVVSAKETAAPALTAPSPDVSQLRAESADASSKSLAAGEHPEKVTSSETI